jgi:hypothetical protein
MRPAPAALIATLLLTACSSEGISYSKPASPTRSPCAETTTVTVAPVKGGDINTMFLTASVSDASGKALNEPLSFYLTRGGGSPRQGLEAGLPDDRARTVLDLGGNVATRKEVREEALHATTLLVEYGGRSATGGRTKLCASSREIEFAPSVRDYEPVASGVTSASRLVARLREVGTELQHNKGPYLMPDGSSPCRLLASLVADLDSHQSWFEAAAAKDASERLHEGLFSCLGAPMLTALDAGTAADTLAGT